MVGAVAPDIDLRKRLPVAEVDGAPITNPLRLVVPYPVRMRQKSAAAMTDPAGSHNCLGRDAERSVQEVIVAPTLLSLLSSGSVTRHIKFEIECVGFTRS
jgi:hypothetical protein